MNISENVCRSRRIKINLPRRKILAISNVRKKNGRNQIFDIHGKAVGTMERKTETVLKDKEEHSDA